MRVKSVQLSNFRNHSESALECGGGVNFITGANAQGKTSILEALSYVCLTKSFLQQADKTVAKFGGDNFGVDSVVETDKGVVHHVRVEYGDEKGKKYLLDRNEMRRSADVIGKFPIVVLSPRDFGLTSGSPSERRLFADVVLSQTSRLYLEELLEYRRALRQRNKILLDGKLSGRLDSDLLVAWTDAIISHGTNVMRRRADFVREFQPIFTNAYTALVEYGESPRLVYEPSFAFDDETDISGSFYRAVKRLETAERARGASLAGPHRDDIAFVLNDLPIRDFGSQGQHKSFLVALKIAEFHYIKSRIGETPAMLLDEVMNELDYSRATNTIHTLSSLGQTFITATDLLSFDEKMIGTRDVKMHIVREGNVVYENVRL